MSQSLLFFLFPFFLTAPDTQPPTIACPGQPITQTSIGVNTLVTFTRPTAEDDCGTVNVACTAWSPTNSAITLSVTGNQEDGFNEQGSFPLGISTVVCTATDGASLTASCNLNVVVSEGILTLN